MAVPSAKSTWITPGEYYRLEHEALEKSDWYQGEMFNMAGGSTNHSRIKMNLAVRLGNQLNGRPCEPLDSDQRLKIAATGIRTYPDASVYCGPLEYDEEDAYTQTATNPTVLFEVLSDSTEAYDRGLKADSYRQIPSLKAYVLMSQKAPHAELYERLGPNEWRLSEARGLEATLRIPCIAVDLPLAELYDRVEFGTAKA